MTRLSTRTKKRLTRTMIDLYGETTVAHHAFFDAHPHAMIQSVDAQWVFDLGWQAGKLSGFEHALRALFGPSEKHKFYDLSNEMQGPMDTLLEGNAVYTTTNFPTKKALKEAVKEGREVRLFAPGVGAPKTNGTEAVEGPWYPQPHRWYAEVEVKDGRVVKVK